MVEVRPTVSADVDGSTEINVIGLEAFRAKLVPPVQVAWLPVLKGPLQAAIASEISRQLGEAGA